MVGLCSLWKGTTGWYRSEKPTMVQPVHILLWVIQFAEKATSLLPRVLQDLTKLGKPVISLISRKLAALWVAHMYMKEWNHYCWWSQSCRGVQCDISVVGQCSFCLSPLACTAACSVNFFGQLQDSTFWIYAVSVLLISFFYCLWFLRHSWYFRNTLPIWIFQHRLRHLLQG